jgi:hypothetical protein
MPLFPRLSAGRQHLLLTAVSMLFGLSGCSDSEPTPDPQPVTPTFHEQVAPILSAQCVSCHQEGGIGPFRLDRYEDARGYADAIASAVSARRMPPWGVDNTGDCQTFLGARWLSDAEIDTISRWAQAGAPEGTSGQAAAPPGSAEHHPGHLLATQGPLASLSGNIVEVGMAVPYVPAPSEVGPQDDYRCFLLDPDLPGDRYVTGFEVLPGNSTLVHHVAVFSVDPEQVVGMGPDGEPLTNAQAMESLQKAEGARPGWTCFGAAGEGVVPRGLPVTWAPGTQVTHYPEGTGLSLRQGHQLVMQVHYHLHGGAGLHTESGDSDQTRVRLELAEHVARPAFVEMPDGFLETAFTPNPASLPPGQESIPYTWTLTGEAAAQFFQEETGTRPSRFEVFGIFPHMHGAGRKLSASLVGGSQEVCMAQVPRWDYRWQQFYFYETPLSWLPSQDLRVTCTFDTRGRTQPTRPGLGTEDEMCLFGLYVVPVN